jgi:hypothetical protein
MEYLLKLEEGIIRRISWYGKTFTYLCMNFFLVFLIILYVVVQ